MKKSKENLKCKKCHLGKVNMIITDLKDSVEIKISKCNNKECQYQYGIKELFKSHGRTLQSGSF